MESQVIVTKEVCALASEDVGLLKGLIQLKSNREVLHRFVQYAQASIAPSSSQMELSCGFLFLLNCDIEVVQGIVEVVQLIVKQPSEEVETWLLLLLAATSNGHIQEPLGLHDFLTFLLIVHIELTQRERVASDYADDIEAEGIFVALKAQRGLAKVFASHQVFFRIHFQNSSTQPFVVDRSLINCCRADGFRFPKIFQSMLILLDRHITIRPIDINIEDEKVILLLVEFTRANLTGFPCDGALLYRALPRFLLYQLRFRFIDIISISLLCLQFCLLLLV